MKHFFWLCACAVVWAVEDTTHLSNDASLQQTARKSILALSDVGLDKHTQTVPSFYKAHDAKKWTPYKTTTVTYDAPYFSQTLLHHYDYLITDRYDKIILESQATIVTPLVRMSIDYDYRPMPSVPLDLPAFETTLTTHLNTHFANKIQSLLSGTLDARYEALSTVDRSSFIEQKAKETGVPLEMVLQLMNAAYSFALHVQPTSAIYVTQNKHQDSKGNVSFDYTSTLELAMPTTLVIHKYDAQSGSFLPYDRVHFTFTAQSAHTTKELPDLRFGSYLAHEALAKAFKSGILALQVKLKEDKNFALLSIVTEAGFFSVKLSAGVQEAVRVDQPFQVLRTINEQAKPVAWVKVKQPGMNCLAAPEALRSDSTARIISGTPEAFDQIQEYAYSGAHTGFGATQESSSLANDWEGGQGTFVTFHATYDKGYISNKTFWSEIYSHWNIGVGTVQDISQAFTPTHGANTQYQGSLSGFLSLGMDRRWYILPNIGFALGLEAGYMFQTYDGGKTGDTYTNDDGETKDVVESLTVGYGFAQPYASIHYTPSPFSVWTLKAGMNYPFATRASVHYSDNYYAGVDLDATHGFTGVNAGLSVRLSYSMHTTFLGNSGARDYAKSNGACNGYKRN